MIIKCECGYKWEMSPSPSMMAGEGAAVFCLKCKNWVTVYAHKPNWLARLFRWLVGKIGSPDF